MLSPCFNLLMQAMNKSALFLNYFHVDSFSTLSFLAFHFISFHFISFHFISLIAVPGGTAPAGVEGCGRCHHHPSGPGFIGPSQAVLHPGTATGR